MQHHSELDDNTFEVLFREGNFPAALFSHEAHLRLAWIHLRRYGLEQAIENVSRQLKQYVALLGAQDKYNETLTVAAVRAVYHFMLRLPEAGFDVLMDTFPRLKNNFKGLMAAHYGFDIYQSALAKREYLQPDLLPFD